jgi:uncharacterized membrane protein YeaQ/YmgE (transglycosylase-associated protein family)
MTITIDLAQVLVWVVIGLIAGSLAEWVYKGKLKRHGRLGTLVLGLIGGIIGGVLFGLLNINLGLPRFELALQDIVAAFVGALIFLFLASVLTRR